jgi:Ran GTPase-activating protein (RanGAP) involved in mRNA processing and transport
MKVSKFIYMLIVGLAIMGFTSMGMAYEEIGETYEEYEKEEVPSETVEEETVAEAESEAELMEEEEYTEEEMKIAPVAGSKEEEFPGIDAPFHY